MRGLSCGYQAGAVIWQREVFGRCADVSDVLLGACVSDLVGARIKTNHLVKMGRQLDRELSIAAADIDRAGARRRYFTWQVMQRSLAAVSVRRKWGRTLCGSWQLAHSMNGISA